MKVGIALLTLHKKMGKAGTDWVYVGTCVCVVCTYEMGCERLKCMLSLTCMAYAQSAAIVVQKYFGIDMYVYAFIFCSERPPRAPPPPLIVQKPYMILTANTFTIPYDRCTQHIHLYQHKPNLYLLCFDNLIVFKSA